MDYRRGFKHRRSVKNPRKRLGAERLGSPLSAALEPGTYKGRAMDIQDFVLSDEALNAIENGVWVDDFESMPELGLFVLGWNSQVVKDCLRQKQVHARSKNDGKALTSDQQAQCVKETLAEATLKDWRGITNSGEPVPYSKAKAKEWLTSKNGERFANIVLLASQRVDTNVNAFIKVATKNS